MLQRILDRLASSLGLRKEEDLAPETETDDNYPLW